MDDATSIGRHETAGDATPDHGRVGRWLASVSERGGFPAALAAKAEMARQPANSLLAFLRYAGRRFGEDNLFLAAAALTYTTLLSLVPLAAIVIAILSAFPAFTQFQDEVQSLVFQAVVPEVGDAVLDQLVVLAENTGGLTAFGLIGVIVTAFLLLATIESAFNNLWRVKISRPLMTRFLSFWAILTFSPILVAFGISVTVQLFSSGPVGGEATLIGGFLRTMIAPVVEFALLMLLFMIIPNTQVNYGDSAIGAAVGTALLELARWVFGIYVGAATYETVYGALATVPIFLIWIYLVWSTVLVSALVAAALPDWRAGRLSAAMDEPEKRFRSLSACVSVLGVLHRASLTGHLAHPRLLRRILHMNTSEIDQVLDALRDACFAVQTDDGQWVLSRDIREATLWTLMEALGYGYEATLEANPDPDQARRVATLIESSREQGQRILSVPLVDLVSDSADQKPASPRGS
ncbi:YihY family inner membrane protein [Fodinicurvata sp. EGI_FJ10296]|uniref:YihY family inner membrane protein n=1 Tax=Fodinicurvata sp. EGI_FJ10296 TaxID=3231908 RepID=UPI00345484C6